MLKYYYGTDELFYIKHGGVFLLVGCLVDNSFNEASEFIGTTTRENAGWKTSRPTLQSFDMACNGLQLLTGNAYGQDDMLSYDRLKIKKRDRELLEWKTETIDGSFIDVGYCYISSIGKASPADGWLTFDISFVGWGTPSSIVAAGDGTPTGGGMVNPTVPPTPVPPVLDVVEITKSQTDLILNAVTGDYYLSLPELEAVNKNPFFVSVNGVEATQPLTKDVSPWRLTGFANNVDIQLIKIYSI